MKKNIKGHLKAYVIGLFIVITLALSYALAVMYPPPDKPEVTRIAVIADSGATDVVYDSSYAPQLMTDE